MKQKNNSFSALLLHLWKEYGVYILFLVCALYIVPHFVAQRTVISGSSMENTFQNGDQVLVEKVTRYVMPYDRFDIIVFEPDYMEAEGPYIKRVIGLPGETVQIIDGQIYIDGEVLEEQFGKGPMKEAGIAAQPIFLDKEEYFVLGDNREVSMDSRYEVIGPVLHSQIKGKVILQIYPFSEFGFVE